MTVITIMTILCFTENKLLHITDEFSSPYIFLCGDFNDNTQRESRFGKELVDMCNCDPPKAVLFTLCKRRDDDTQVQ